MLYCDNSSRCMIERAECHSLQSPYKLWRHWIVGAADNVHVVELNLLNWNDVSFQKHEPLINSKKSSLMWSSGRIRTEAENDSHFRQTNVIAEAIVFEEMKLLNRCHTRDLSFHKHEPLINSKKPSLMQSTGRIRTETENDSHFRQTDVIVETTVLEEMKFHPRSRCHAREFDIPNFRRFWVDTYTFPPLEKICDFSNFSMRKNHLFFTYFPKRWKIYPPPRTSQLEKWYIPPPNPGQV